MSLSNDRARRRAVLGAALVSLIVLALLSARFWFLADDAFISFRYARNLALGRGLVFNPGEEPPVEAYSDLLWVLVLGGLYKLGLSPTVCAPLLSCACAAALVVKVVLRAAAWHPTRPIAFAGAGLCMGTFPSLAVWSSSGLETAPFALALFCMFDAICGDTPRPRLLRGTAWTAALCLLRIDGIYFAALVLLGALISARGSQRRPLARAVVWCGGAAIAAVVAQAMFRLSYHGHLLPHTMQVKVGLNALSIERGAKYLASFILTVASLPLLCWIGAREALGVREPRARALIVPASGGILYPLLVGGDFMAMGRILLPAAAFLSLLLSFPLARARPLPGALVAMLICALSILPAFDLHPVPLTLRERLHFRWNTDHYMSELQQWRQMKENARTWTILGKAVAQRTEQGDSLVAAAVGALGYYSDLWIFDQFGLASPDVVARGPAAERRSAGHDFFVQPEFFLDREPTFLSAALVPSSNRYALLPPSWLEGGELSARVRIEWYGPDRTLQGLGAPPSAILRLVRYLP